jgi:Protein of unknown function (DUF3500)
MATATPGPVSPPRPAPLLAIALAVAVGSAPSLALGLAEEGAPTGGSAGSAAMAEAARKFVASLGPEQRKLAAHPFDGGDRQSFHFVPMARSGAPLKVLNAEQRKLAHALLKTGLSATGYQKVSNVMELETVLAELEKNPVRRDPEMYYFWVFGNPQPGGNWGWKMEGHHLSFNFTVVKGTTIVTTPSFMGANPAEVKSGPLKGRRALRAEEDLARELAKSFTGETRAKVVFDQTAPPDILTTDKSQVDPLPAVGLDVASMKPAQKEQLRKLLAEYAATMSPAQAQERLKKIDQAGFDKLRFGWAGGLERGDKHYYRIQGPTFLLEYDSTQNDGNHIHSVWRDFNGDFGRDLLREHRAASH